MLFLWINNLEGKHLTPASLPIMWIPFPVFNSEVTIALQLLHRHKQTILKTVVGLKLIKKKLSMIQFRFLIQNWCKDCCKINLSLKCQWNHINLHFLGGMIPIVVVTIIVKLKVTPLRISYHWNIRFNRWLKREILCQTMPDPMLTPS